MVFGLNKSMNRTTTLLKVAIIQRYCPHYRIPLFRRISQLRGIDLTVIVNDPKAANWDKQSLGFNFVHASARILKFEYGLKSYRITFSPALVKHLWQNKYDIVITEGITNIVNNVLIYPVIRLQGSKYVWWGAGRRRFARKNFLRRLADPFTHYLIRNADANIAYGTVARDYMISVGASPKKVFIAQNTIDTDPIFGSLDETTTQASKLRRQLGLDKTKVILYVGVIERRKKIENLLLAYKEVLERSLQPVSLVIVGDGPHLPALKQWREDNLPSVNVHFAGKIIEEVGAYFAMCDVFVLPSEGGLALNQAMAYGKPVIATSADGTEIDLIQQGKNGYIVEEDDIESLAGAVLDILGNSIRQTEMGMSSIQLMKEEYTLDNMVKKFQIVFHLLAHS